jgi:hypothetical protein
VMASRGQGARRDRCYVVPDGRGGEIRIRARRPEGRTLTALQEMMTAAHRWLSQGDVEDAAVCGRECESMKTTLCGVRPVALQAVSEMERLRAHPHRAQSAVNHARALDIQAKAEAGQRREARRSRRGR